MTNEMMCFWINQKLCKFSDIHSAIYIQAFKDEYCTFCMKAKLINEVSNMNKKLDRIIKSMKK